MDCTSVNIVVLQKSHALFKGIVYVAVPVGIKHHLLAFFNCITAFQELIHNRKSVQLPYGFYTHHLDGVT